MHSILANSGKKSYGIKTYLVATEAEMHAIPLLSTLAPGSTVFVLSTASKYILNRKRKWVKVFEGTPDDSNQEENGDIIYEGGDLDTGVVEEADLDYDGGMF